MSPTWTQAEAIELCRQIEAVCPAFGCHVALTGGLLYKEGSRKDADILFYRIRQVPEIDEDGLLQALGKIGLDLTTEHGWVQKAFWKGKAVDLFFPDRPALSDYGITERVEAPVLRDDEWVF